MSAFIIGVFSITACQHSSDDALEYSELLIELTDAEGDFNSYSVDILSLTLTKQDDSVVEALPENTRVDFAQYVEMSEILTTASIPSGVYKSATLTLDYSNAEIFVEDAEGNSVEASSIVDEDNNPITILESKVTLDDRNRLRIVPGVPAHLSLDFDLKTSNAVNLDDPTAPVITVSPVLNASLEPDLEKTHRARGPLKKVDLDNNSFDLIIRPFRHKFSHKREHFGNLRIEVNEETLYEIDNTHHTGNDGLIAINELAKATAIIVIGDVSRHPKRFQATEVYAGTSVPGGDLDVVKGTVLSRIDNTIIVKGATLIRSDVAARFNDETTVILGEDTIVKRQHDNSEYSTTDISIGQHVNIFGTLNDDANDPILDASEGKVKMLATSLAGVVVAEKDESTSQYFSVDLAHLNGKLTEKFDFTGTGIDTENDADPLNYEIETSTLSLDAFPLESSVNIKGFVNGFGQAPADFIATSINNKERKFTAKMHANWKPASGNAIASISSDAIVLDFSEAGRFHHLGKGHHKVDLAKLDVGFSFIPIDTSATYIIIDDETRIVHTEFGAFGDELSALITAGKQVSRIHARGDYNVNTGELTATTIKIKLK